MTDHRSPASEPGSAGGQQAPDAIRIESVVEDFLAAKGKGRTSDTGSYARNLERDVTTFVTFLGELEPPVETFEDLTDYHCRQYAQHLDTRDIAAGTVLTYYRNVSAFLGWCTREDLLDENPAQTDRATEPLPEDDGRRSGDQQAWTPDDRDAITSFVDRQAADALEDLADAIAAHRSDDTTDPVQEETDDHLKAAAGISERLRARWDAIQVLRDRALVYLVGYTGIRGAELLAHPGDDRREGATWGDLGPELARLTVFAKTQDYDDRAVPAQCHRPLRQYRRLLDPHDDWPLFVTLHRGTLYDRLRERLPADHDVAPETVEEWLSERPTFALYREYDVVPPALTTDGARRVMKRLTDDAGIDVDGDHDYLTLHGARRGAGEAIVRERGYAAAARVLDDTEQMVRERYSHIEAGELAEVVTDAFDDAE